MNDQPDTSSDHGPARDGSRAEEDGPPGTSRNPITGEVRERHVLGSPNQHDLSEETPETDTARHYHGAVKVDSTPKEV